MIADDFTPFSYSTWDKYCRDDRQKTHQLYMGLYNAIKKEEEEFKGKVKSYEDELRGRDIKVKELEATIERLQSSLTLVLNPEDVTKEVIKMYSKGNGALVIHKNLTEFKKMNVEYETITDIIFKLENEDLPIHLMEYYNECIKTLLANPISEEEKIKVEELRRLKSHQEQSDAILNDIKKRLATCSVDEVKELTDLMMKVMDNQRRTSESMSKWNRGNGQNGIIENGSNNASSIKEQLEKASNAIVENFDPSKMQMMKVM